MGALACDSSLQRSKGHEDSHHTWHMLRAQCVGVDFIECDVVWTKDLVPICRHEPYLSLTTNVLNTTLASKVRAYTHLHPQRPHYCPSTLLTHPAPPFGIPCGLNIVSNAYVRAGKREPSDGCSVMAIFAAEKVLLSQRLQHHRCFLQRPYLGRDKDP